MARKNEFDYFEKFVKLSEYCCSASKMLDETLKNYNVEELQTKMKAMHQIEHEADLEGHEITRKLANEFITPIEREDIISLLHAIDDITDCIEDVLLHMYMYNVKSIRKEALEFSEIIAKSCEGVKATMEEFKNFRKSKEIHKGIVLVNRLEEDGDNLYTEAVRNLHMTSTDPIEIMTWTDGFNQIEKCCDACEEAVNVVEGIIMKNS
jgi:predicted phosphate transport protein (TIGR00153 family)